MLKIIVATFLLFTLFFSFGEIEKCTLSECEVTSMELCLDCIHCGHQLVRAAPVTLRPIEISSDSFFHEFLNHLRENNRPQEIFRPPIVRA